MRKVIFLLCVMALAFPVLVFAQDATPEATPAATAVATESPAWVCPDGFNGQSLSVFNWTTYVAEDTIGNFEKLCGVKVVALRNGVIYGVRLPRAAFTQWSHSPKFRKSTSEETTESAVWIRSVSRSQPAPSALLSVRADAEKAPC